MDDNLPTVGGGSLEPADDAAFDLDLLASSLQANGGDTRVLLKVLVGRLADILGDRLEIERAGRFGKKAQEIRQLTVRLGDDEMRAEIDGSRLTCTVGHSSGGIRIRSDRVTVDEWLRRLLGALQTEAHTSEATRAALESILIGGNP